MLSRGVVPNADELFEILVLLKIEDQDAVITPE